MHSTVHTRVSSQRARAGGLPTSCYSKCNGTPWSRHPAFLYCGPPHLSPTGQKGATTRESCRLSVQTRAKDSVTVLPCARQRCAKLFAFSRRHDGADGCSWNARDSDKADKRDKSFAPVLCSSSRGLSRMSITGKKLLCCRLCRSLPDAWRSPCS